MTTYGIPLFFEDKTGKITGSDFVDIYDRSPMLRVAQVVQSDRILRYIYDVGSTSIASSRGYSSSEPEVTLEFGTDYSLGSIYFGRSSSRSIPMERYLRRLSPSGSSLVRVFRASDGSDYIWGYRVDMDHEWTVSGNLIHLISYLNLNYHEKCTNMSTLKLIGHYDLKPAGEPPYRSSGNVLTVYEEYQHLSIGMA
ncbi:hypothetical protein Clacol_002210 [Clathrus columnatus]|uniref:Uncharacterized protein n=1 Tax=Clathrus columnatus TaxID=1419009 RepID=A0AAV5A467_9AGAM|nr:hypothetical protein Clacol_002210 [Clathrus columnatus]